LFLHGFIEFSVNLKKIYKPDIITSIFFNNSLPPNKFPKWHETYVLFLALKMAVKMASYGEK